MTLPPVFRGDTRKLLLRLVANGVGFLVIERDP